METHIATRKNHRCSECGKRIPIGARYFADCDGGIREHTNCLDFENEDVLPIEYNSNRTKNASRNEAIRQAYDYNVKNNGHGY